VLRLVELSVGTLVCGAISRPTLAVIEAYGIEVRPFLAGELCEVVLAWLEGKLDGSTFGMPGCGCRHRRSRGGGGSETASASAERRGSGRAACGQVRPPCAAALELGSTRLHAPLPLPLPRAAMLNWNPTYTYRK
jgi:predicted Fe-Mo cluster-binding NifX family protein